MAEVVGMAVREGANVVNIPDTVGYLNPSEYGAIFKYLKENVPDIEKVRARTAITIWAWRRPIPLPPF